MERASSQDLGWEVAQPGALIKGPVALERAQSSLFKQRSCLKREAQGISFSSCSSGSEDRLRGRAERAMGECVSRVSAARPVGRSVGPRIRQLCPDLCSVVSQLVTSERQLTALRHNVLIGNIAADTTFQPLMTVAPEPCVWNVWKLKYGVCSGCNF